MSKNKHVRAQYLADCILEHKGTGSLPGIFQEQCPIPEYMQDREGDRYYKRTNNVVENCRISICKILAHIKRMNMF